MLFKNVKQDRIFIDGLTLRFRKDGVQVGQSISKLFFILETRLYVPGNRFYSWT
jgi:hypothetical protein